MNPRQLEVFHAIMREGSISDAARALGISQPAVTKSLRLMEQALGIVLFLRVGGRIFPSPAAETLAPEVARALGEIDAVGRLAGELREGRAGRLEIAALPALSEWLLPKAIVQLRDELPNVRVEILSLPSQQVVEQVAQRQVDFGIVYDPSENPYVEAENLSQAEVVCALARDHPLAKRPFLTPADLENLPLIGYRPDTFIGTRFLNAMHAAGLRRDFDIVTNYSHLSVRLVAAGAGIAIIDPFAPATAGGAEIATVPFRPTIPLCARILRARERPRSLQSIALVRALRRAMIPLAEAGEPSGRATSQ